MSELGVQLVWAALQVTLLALLVIVFAGFGARGRPAGRAAITAVGFAAAIGLTLVALCPLPAWWTWAQPIEQVTVNPLVSAVEEKHGSGENGKTTAETDVDVPSGSSFLLPVSAFARAWRSVAHSGAPAERHPWSWSTVVAIVFGMGSAWCLARLALGWWSVRRLCQRSRPVDDPGVQQRLAALREAMGCRHPVALRESAELSTAATTGWLRPRLLLPADWRDWSPEELSAVLAHELAHICRADYAAWLTARLCAALHFYHPLVHYLVRRLHLHQELAADALGANFAGGRSIYLRALAALALRRDDRPLTGPARAFLPARGTLMRRIAMLREGTRIECKPPSRRGRLLLLSCLCLAGLGLSALRGPAQAPAERGEFGVPTVGPVPIALDFGFPIVKGRDNKGEKAGGYQVAAGAGQRITVKQNRPPFIFARHLPDSTGIIAFRPAETFSSPEMKKLAALWEKELDQALKEYGLAEAIPSLSQIEQVTGVMHLSNNPQAPKGSRHSLAVSLPLVRATKDYDWNTLIDKFKHSEKLLKLICEKAEEVRYEGKVYYRLINAPILAAQTMGRTGGPDMCVGLLDKHTLVLDDEENIKKLFREGPAPLPEWIAQAGWQSVANGLLAIAVDNRKKTVTQAIDEDDKPLDSLKPFFDKTTSAVFGIDATPDATKLTGMSTFTDEKVAEEAAKAVQGLLAAASLALDLELKGANTPEPELIWYQEFLHHAKIERLVGASGKQTVLHVHSQANLDMKKLVDFINASEQDKKK
jgi:beta-lactamase regulating signal transducer with metallopeptidase domain